MAATLMPRGVASREDPPGLTDEFPASFRHQSGHDQSGDGVSASPASEHDDEAGESVGDEGEQVVENVLERTLDIEGGSVGASDQPGRHHGDADSDKRGDQNEPAGHLRRVKQPPDGLVDKPGGKEPQVIPFACAERISTRFHPDVRFPAAGRAASRAAIRTRAMAAASVSMWPASEINASDEAMMPTTTSVAINAKINAKAPARYLEFRGPAAESLWPPGPWRWPVIVEPPQAGVGGAPRSGRGVRRSAG
jgi:hypothetical protein